ncbi:hypothetical protein CQ010_02025 [Arthrobacter sp. MYb211]|uniref:hypothetical protein n=1 Tax=unclassified Arthrobacter TaxID=235627 RepID=UPI000CFD1C0A|nr:MULTISPECIES: hypothetical protein [unclassified Arthrobacter]PRA13445.1 hypothetical protein CQ015_04280 [Arthrobacter sp. MYb221]PRC10643.1 hypothetical protein CQ010_02025 [Arthrobacter sp. MYb211]
MSEEAHVEYCGQWFGINADQVFTIGREGDLAVDDNPYLHRNFLTVSKYEGMWWLSNVGSRLTATVADKTGGLQAWLSPGSRLPLVFNRTSVVFTAGPTTYELGVHVARPAFRQEANAADPDGATTIGPVTLTESQRALVIALAEPMLRRDGTGLSSIPSSNKAAERLGWAITKFNRKLDNVCDKLDKAGIAGLRGGPGKLASNRKARLVEHAVSSRLVTRADLAMLDRALPDED